MEYSDMPARFSRASMSGHTAACALSYSGPVPGFRRKRNATLCMVPCSSVEKLRCLTLTARSMRGAGLNQIDLPQNARGQGLKVLHALGLKQHAVTGVEQPVVRQRDAGKLVNGGVGDHDAKLILPGLYEG